MIRARLPDLMKSAPTAQTELIERRLGSLLPDGALLLAIENRVPVGIAALDLDHARLLALYLDPKSASAEAARSLVREIERTARSFGLQRLSCTVKAKAWPFMERLGYEAAGTPVDDAVTLSRRLLDERCEYELRIAQLHRELGIPASYGAQRRLRIVPEAQQRIAVGHDIFNRACELTPEAAEAWKAIQAGARQHDVTLQLVSAWRSVHYQAELIRRKLERGQDLDRILAVSAAPGYSEHHSGVALDLTCPGVTPLTSEFADSKAYQWLKARARIYGFHESYPPHNRHGLEWEPWHWAFKP